MPKKNKPLISIGIPCYNEELNVDSTYKALKKIAESESLYSFEYVFVDNGSLDNTRGKLEKLAKKDSAVKSVFLARNFGPEASGQATLDFATGDAFVFVEADLQDPPELISKFLRLWEQGYEVIVGTRTNFPDNPFIAFGRRLFYKIFRGISNIDVPLNAGSFCLLDQRVLSVIRQLPEKYRLFRGLRAWVGFKSITVKYTRRARTKGRSYYNMPEYIRHAERGFFGFSYIPLDILLYSGFFLFSLSLIFMALYIPYIIILQTEANSIVFVIVMMFFFAGIQLAAISIIGKYIQITVEESRHRPLYIVDKTINTNEKKA